jgi:hypothetical protein
VPIRVTVVKPSGTLAPLGNAPPGVHPPIEGRHVIRRMRVPRTKPMSAQLAARGVPNEVDAFDPSALVFEFALDQGDMRSAEATTMWELGHFACITQDAYVDNSTSFSNYVDFNIDTPAQIAAFLKMHLWRMKSISFMTRSVDKLLKLVNGATVSFPYFADHSKMLMLLEAIGWVDPAVATAFKEKPRAPYVQAPYEAITVEEYVKRAAVTADLDFAGTRYVRGDIDLIVGCDGMKCSRD